MVKSPAPVQPIKPASIIILNCVSWQTFKTLMAEVGDGRPWRIAYDRGTLEIRMPLTEHEEPKKILLANFVEVIADELEMEVRQLGALTLEREDLTRAVEPDTCVYIQNESRVRSRREINLPDDPLPDLVIESDYASSSINKFVICGSMGVPEIWRYRRQSLEVYQRVEENYESALQSIAFPFLPVGEVPGFIEQSRTVGQRSAVRLFRQHIQEILANQTN